MLNCLSSRAAASVVKHCLLAPALVPPCRSCAVLLPGSRSVYVTPGARPAALHFQRIVRRNVATMSGQATATSRNADGQGAVHISNAFLSGAQQKQRLWLILLNHTLPDITTALWDRAHYKLCADGGANRLVDEVAVPQHLDLVPDAIVGDLDSLRPDVRQNFARAGVHAVDLAHDQDTTDLDKSILAVQEQMRQNETQGLDDIVVAVGAIGGRLDHTLSNLNALYMYPQLRLVLVGEGNIVRLLNPGTTEIAVDKAEGQHCGVVPLARPARVTSKGLRWDMDDMELAFAGMISTSNHIDSDIITISVDAPCLWITCLRAVT